MHGLVKTKYKNIYEKIDSSGEKQFIVTFRFQGRKYEEYNFTQRFNTKTAKKTSEKLIEVKSEIRQGRNPLLKNSSDKIDDLVVTYLETTPKAYKEKSLKTYNKHAKPIIGHLFIGNVKRIHLEKIVSTMLSKGLSPATVKKVRVILNPVFERAYQDELINRNHIQCVKFGKDQAKTKLNIRLQDSLIVTAQKLYKATMNFEKKKYKFLYLISLMCGRRIGEIAQLQYRDINLELKYVITREETTKTNVVEQYPIPDEVVEIIKELGGMGSQLIYDGSTRACSTNFNKMIEKSNIKLNNGFKYTSHDNRHLFMSIGKKTHPIHLVNKCLSHADDALMSENYSSYEQNDLNKVYAEYWNILRK